MSARQASRGLAHRLALAALLVLLACLPQRTGADPGTLPPPLGPCFPPLPEPPCCPPCPAPFGRPPAPAAAALGDPSVPTVLIQVRAPATVAAGKEIEYRLLVRNVSQAAAHHVIVRNPVPAHARLVRSTPEPSAREPELLWQLGTLTGGGQREIVLVLAPTGTDEVRNCARVQFEHGQCVTTQVARPSISLRKVGPAQAVLYDFLRYQLSVTNTGAVEVTGVELRDQLPQGLEIPNRKPEERNLIWALGTLAPGQTRTVEYQAIAKAVGSFRNLAVATADGGLRTEAASTVAVTEPKLTLQINGPTRGYINHPATYVLTVTNTGSAPLGNVTLTCPLPAPFTFVSASERGLLSGGQVQWLLGSLAPEASRSVTLVVRAGATGRHCLKPAVLADRGQKAEEELCTEFGGAAALLLKVTDTVDPVEVGAATSYVITVVNQGMVPATGVVMAATLPEQMSLTQAGPGTNRQEGQVVRFEPVTIQPQAEVRYQIDVKAVRAGDVRFKVDLSADQLPAGPVHSQEPTTIFTGVPPVRLERGL